MVKRNEYHCGFCTVHDRLLGEVIATDFDKAYRYKRGVIPVTENTSILSKEVRTPK